MSETPILEDYLELVTYGFTNPMPDSDVGPWKITAKDVIDGEINFNTARKTTQEAFDKKLTKKSRPKIGDILLTKDGTLGRLAIVQQEGICINQSVAVLRPNKKILPEYLFYLLSTPEYQRKMIGDSDGTVIKHIYITRVGKMEVDIPPIEEQKERLKHLLALDGKIKLNRQTNQTLEQIAQAIFKSWFVDLDPVIAKIAAKQSGASAEQIERAAMCAISGKTEAELEQCDQATQQQLKTTAALFPDAFVESELGEVPEGWEIKTFGDVSQCFDSKRVPLSKKKREEKKPGKIPYYGATSVMDYVNEWLFDDIYLLLGEDGSVIKEDGTPFVQYIWGKTWVNNHAHVLKGKNGVSTEQLMIFIQSQNIAAYITGAVQLKLNQGNMNSIPFLDGGEAINLAFYDLIKPLYEKIRNTIEENKILILTRNTLLPKLLSGELETNSEEAA